MRPLPSLAVCVLLVGLTGCPEDSPGGDTDVTEPLDGQTCEPGAIVECVE